MPINSTDYLRDLATRIRKIPVSHGVDGYDIDALREVSQGIAELEKANVAYVDANTGLIRENKELRLKLFPYADSTEISGISWDGKYLIGDKASISFFHEMKNRGEQIDVYKQAYDQNIAAKDAEIAKLREALEPFSNFAGIVFARNFENTDPVDTMRAHDGSKVTLFASDYFAARAALAKVGEA